MRWYTCQSATKRVMVAILGCAWNSASPQNSWQRACLPQAGIQPSRLGRHGGGGAKQRVGPAGMEGAVPLCRHRRPRQRLPCQQAQLPADGAQAARGLGRRSHRPSNALLADLALACGGLGRRGGSGVMRSRMTRRYVCRGILPPMAPARHHGGQRLPNPALPAYRRTRCAAPPAPGPAGSWPAGAAWRQT